MSAAIQQRDIRSASVPFKRDREHHQKWSNGARPHHGVRPMEEVIVDGVIQTQYKFNGSSRKEPNKSEIIKRTKVRPNTTKILLGTKTHANRTPKPFSTSSSNAFLSGTIQGRLDRKADAYLESHSPDITPSLSESLIAILPQHVNNASPAISTLDADILYSFDNKGPSPTNKGTKVELGSLIEQAEQKWIAEQTERIVRGEYEVLDGRGEKTVLGRKRGSPRVKVERDSVGVEEEDDGFELV